MRGILVLSACLGCAAAPQVEAGVCGNRIVEADEDCDDPEDPSCSEACRWSCAGEVACPMGFGCGSDRVCREPSGAFAETVHVEGGALWIEHGDLDGDGREELVVEVPNANGTVSHRVVSLDAEGRADVTVLHEGEPMAGAIGDLDGDGLDDVFLTGDGTMMLFTGDPSGHPRRRFLPTVRTEGSRGRLLSPLPQRDYVFEFTRTDVRVWSSDVVDPPPSSIVAPGSAVDLGRSAPSLLFPLLGEDCGFVVLPYTGQAVVRLFLACPDGSWNPQGNVRLEESRVGEAGAFFERINEGDDFFDLIVQGDNGNIFAAYGRGNGTFRSTPPSFDEGEDAVLALHLELPRSVRLLAVGDLDADPQPEFFTDQCVYDDDGACLQEIQPAPKHAVTIDLNGDDALDALALSDATLFELFGGSTREVFEVHERPLLGPGRNLKVGDFDRDARLEAAFIEDQQWITVYRDGELTRHGPFAAVDDFAVEHGAGIVVRVFDDAGRAQGAFLRFDEPQPALGFTLGPPAIGTFAGAASVAAVLNGPGHRFTHLPFAPRGRFSVHDFGFGEVLSGAADIASYLALPVDLDGDALDELVTVGPQEFGARLWVASPLPEGLGLGVETEFVLGPPVGRPGSTIDAADVDGDGDLDVLLTSSVFPRHLQVRTNVGGFLVESEAHDITQRADLEAGLVQAWHPHTDGTPRLFVSGELGAAIADLDLEGRQLLPARVGPETPDLAIAVADLDGDGRLDLVRASADALSVYRAQ